MSVGEYLALKRVRMREILVFCTALLAWLLVSDQLAVLFRQPVVPEVMIEAYRTAYLPPLLWLALIVGAPLSEEVFFRGFLFKGMPDEPLRLPNRFGSDNDQILGEILGYDQATIDQWREEEVLA